MTARTQLQTEAAEIHSQLVTAARRLSKMCEQNWRAIEAEHLAWRAIQHVEQMMHPEDRQRSEP